MPLLERAAPVQAPGVAVVPRDKSARVVSRPRAKARAKSNTKARSAQFVPDATLVAALRAREPGAQEALVARYAVYVESLIVRTIGFDQEVPDLVNDVFVHAFEGIHELRDSSALKGWIGSIAVFTARGFLRDQGRRRRWVHLIPFDELPDPPGPAWHPETTEMLRHASTVLAALPLEDRAAFTLRVASGMRLAQIAKIAGVSLATVKRRVARAEKRLRDAGIQEPLAHRR